MQNDELGQETALICFETELLGGSTITGAAQAPPW
jgi:hypothetical protein